MTIDLKEKQLEKVIERVVIRVLQKTLKDPDFGLELQPDFEKSLRNSVASSPRNGSMPWNRSG